MQARQGQAMLESILAVLFITFLFLTLFYFSHGLTVKLLLDHAAARAARARAVGFNDFMCEKTARIAILPVAGKSLLGDAIDTDTLDARVPIYLSAYDAPIAAGLLDYERWHSFKVSPGGDTKTRLTFELFGQERTLEGEAEIELGYLDYL